MRTILLLMMTVLLGTHIARADSDDLGPTQDDHADHKLIKPTSPGTSGSVGDSGGAASSGSGEEGSLAGTELPRSQSQSGSEGGQINPYPNAVNNAGQLVGGSVTGTGAMNSAHPGH